MSVTRGGAAAHENGEATLVAADLTCRCKILLPVKEGNSWPLHCCPFGEHRIWVVLAFCCLCRADGVSCGCAWEDCPGSLSVQRNTCQTQGTQMAGHEFWPSTE